MNLRDFTRKYCEKDNRIAAASFFGTFAVYFGSLWIAIAFRDAWAVMIPAGIVHAFASVRLYVLQHDTGHLSLFETRAQNTLAGIALSPFTFAPYEVMKQNHNLHHAGTGNLDHRETGEIHTMTLREWEAADGVTRLRYRQLALLGVYFHMGSKPAFSSAAERASSHLAAKASPSSFMSIFDHAPARTFCRSTSLSLCV